MNAAILLLTCMAWPASQQVALFESFDQGVPPVGWSEVQNQPLSPGWSSTADGRACHLDGNSSTGPCDDELRSPVLDLRGYVQVHAHFACELDFADYLANHPNSSGDGETDLLLRVQGGSWVEVWTDTRTVNGATVFSVDLTAWCAGSGGVELALRYYGTFAHVVWFDWLEVGEDPVPPPPPPPPPQPWTVDLPLAYLPLTPGATGGDDLEAWGGQPPAHMALSSVDPATGLPAPDGLCSIAGGNAPAASGIRCLEMGLEPGSSSFSNVRNALVLGLDGSGTQGMSELRFHALNFGEETHPFDGVWISTDGANWSRLLLGWSSVAGNWGPSVLDLGAVRHWTLGRFFLMFGQEDNFPYATTDGVGVDDLAWDVDGPPPPLLTRAGSCPGAMQVRAERLTPGGSVLILYGGAGTYVQNLPGYPCLGLSIDLAPPRLGAQLSADALGVAQLGFQAPNVVCGLTVQAVDLTSCRKSNWVIL